VRKDEEYTANAADTLGLAERASTPEDRCRLLNLAERWLVLADRVRRRATPRNLREGCLTMRDGYGT
jgi:hypothetical protein